MPDKTTLKLPPNPWRVAEREARTALQFVHFVASRGQLQATWIVSGAQGWQAVRFENGASLHGMNFLPIVERELRVSARRRATHWGASP